MKYTYIFKFHPGFFVESDRILEDWEDGSTYEDYLRGKFVLLSQQQVEFHIAHPEASVKEVWDMSLIQRTIEEAKNEMLNKIMDYDSSDLVNGFYLNGNLMWLPISERANALLTLQSAQALGLESVPYLGVIFPVAEGIMAINMVNIYAAQCVAVTENHKAMVSTMTSIDEIDGYDYTIGYPERLVFNFNNDEVDTH